MVAAALVLITLLLTIPLASLASARAEARAGGAVAIAGGDDCDVVTNDDEDVVEVQDDVDEDADEVDIFDMEDQDNGDQSQTSEDTAGQTSEDNANQTSENNVSQAQYQDNGDQVQNGNSGPVVARAGDAVAIAGGGCDAETETVETEENNTGDVAIEDDDEISELTVQDGETQNTSDVTTLPLAEESLDEQQSANETTTRRSGFSFGGELGENKSGKKLRKENSALRQEIQPPSRSKTGWPFLREGELDELGEPRRYDPKPNAVMTLSIKALGLYDAPVRDSNTRKAFDRGVVHAPDTAYPWDGTNQKNVFLAGHRLGPPEEDGRLIFYDLDELKPGDEIVLQDRRDRSYKYRVRGLFKVGPKDAWVADTLVGRDLLTLQTYTLPNSEDRLVVRAESLRSRE